MYGITDIRNYGCTELRMTVITTEVRETRPKTRHRGAREKRTDVQTVRENLKLVGNG